MGSDHRLKLQKDGYSLPEFMIKNDLYITVTIYTIKLTSMLIKFFFMNYMHSVPRQLYVGVQWPGREIASHLHLVRMELCTVILLLLYAFTACS